MNDESDLKCLRCDGKHKIRGFCWKCYKKFILLNPHLKINIRKDGYRIITKRGHPNSYKDGRILEHTYVMSEHLGRPLQKNESVHHKNGNRSDNRIENLELWITTRSGQRLDDLIESSIKFLESWGYAVTKSVKQESSSCKAA